MVIAVLGWLVVNTLGGSGEDSNPVEVPSEFELDVDTEGGGGGGGGGE